ncbi:MFS transporter [Eubacterium sp.]|uniref:MFS transporter n=1 Tax=Eubacterium sp. TaxID=142586 RepID=UPI0026016A93|nr:MFS transporter [Eubacterium sp.]MDD7331698.1 MFS transporter [Eubacterium sp.]MDY5243563.1 MFS transporter [Eubacterium sp.]
MNNLAKTYTKKEAAGFLVGMFGQNLIYNIVATGLYFYFQNVICLPAMALGWIMTIARIWDAINDPMMGTIVDKTHSKWGKCRPYLIIFPAIIGLITILAFLNGNYATADTTTQKVLIVAWAAISYIAWGMCFTVCDIPLWGITSLMTEDENDRSKILGLARMVAGVGGIGVLVVQIAQAVAGAFGGDMQKGFIVTVIIMTVVATILFEFAGLFTKERVDKSEKSYTFKENFKIMFGNKPFRQILISGILRSPIQLLMIVAMTLVTYYYANGNIMNILVYNDDGSLAGINVKILIGLGCVAAGLFVGQFVAMGVTPLIIKKVEKKTLYNVYSIAGAVPYALIFVFYKVSGGDLTTTFWSIIIGICMLFGSAAFGGINVLQSVMIADCVDYEEYYNGVRTDGVFFSGQSFITKLAAGISTIVSSAVYAIVGYSGANVDKLNKAIENGANFLTYDGGTGAGKYAEAMFFLISIPPAIGMILSAIPTLKYAMTDAEHKEILSELVSRRKGTKED